MRSDAQYLAANQRLRVFPTSTDFPLLPTSEISYYLSLFERSGFCWISLDFVGYTGLVSQDAAYPLLCFNNMFFESFYHHSRVTHMYTYGV